MNRRVARSASMAGFRPDWRLGLLTLTCTLLLLIAWAWVQFVHDGGVPPVLLADVGPLMVVVAVVYVGVLVTCSLFVGAALSIPGVATWALLVALFIFGVLTLNSVSTALWGYTPLGIWDALSLTGVGTLSMLVFSQSLWNRWLSKRAADRETLTLDLLTGVLNRQSFLAQFGALSQAHRIGSLAVIDINQLKSINDRHGHSVGDNQIQCLAEALQLGLPPHTLISRWGGDEFVVFLASQTAVTSRERLQTLQRRLPSLALFSPVFAFGLTELEDDQNFERGFALADHELYLAKSHDREQGKASEEDRWLVDYSRRLEGLKTTQEVVAESVALVRQAFQFDTASYLQLERQELRVVAVDLDTPFQPARELGHLFPYMGIGQQAIGGRQTVVSVDYPSDPQAVAQIIESGVKSMVVTPVQTEGQVVGLLALCHLTTWKAIPLATQQLFEDAAFRLSHVLDLHRAVAAVRSTLEGGLLGLGVALEARDLETRGHTERVVMLATCLGETLHFTALELDELRQGAYLHDIGKLSIPDRILLKPGALDAEEWAVMKSHVQHGVTIAARIPNLAPGVLDVIRAHHERWDGTGYPAGLRGEEIPLAARIFAVCDVYDALTSDRPYKRAWTPEAARAEIASQVNRQFCPVVIQVFLALPWERLDRERHQDENRSLDA